MRNQQYLKSYVGHVPNGFDQLPNVDTKKTELLVEPILLYCYSIHLFIHFIFEMKFQF